jgi:GxxExxY protein
MGLSVRRQVGIPIRYEGVSLEAGFRADIIVEGCVIVELKTVDKLAPIHEAQLMTHLRLSGIKAGLVLNFNQLRVSENLIRRVV